MKRTYELSVNAEFCAAHRLVGYAGACSRTHGHNWTVTACVRCSELDDLGMGIDFRELKNLLREAIADMDHAFLNDLEFFADANPTAENIARCIFERLSRLLAARFPENGAQVACVRVAETPGAEVSYREEP